MATRNGTVGMTLVIEHMCRLITKYGAAITVAVNAAATAGTITTAQASTLEAFLAGAQAACVIIKAVSGY
jgi:predicted anti-sigma-YlaC factor YlaD